MIFKKKQIEEVEVIDEVVPKVKLAHFESIKDASNQTLTTLAEKIIKGRPVILNFDELSIDDSNKTIAFLSGVVFAIEGHINQINEQAIMFGDKDLYKDKSIEEVLKKLEEDE